MKSQTGDLSSPEWELSVVKLDVWHLALALALALGFGLGLGVE